MFFQLVKELAEKEKITEELKSNDQMLWVQKMNNIRNRVTETVNKEIIYAFELQRKSYCKTGINPIYLI